MQNRQLQDIQDQLIELEANPNLERGKSVAKAVIGLLVPDSDQLPFRQFSDQAGKLSANAGWFETDSVVTDRLATYVLEVPPAFNLDVKLYGVKDASIRTISWSVGLTENFEDEPFNGRYNVGIDFIIPKSKDRVIIALSKNYVVRTLELKGKLTATFQQILESWAQITDFSKKPELHSALWGSFDLHPVNKRFYEGISQRFIHLRQHLENERILETQHAAQFANRLIGRVIFTWFLDKKGFLDEKSRYFASEDFDNDTYYYRDRLEALFFKVLNTPIIDRTVDDLLTPYLNGGLFEPKLGDLYRSETLDFPANYFDDLFDFLRGYNFTTDESTSEYQQVAIDPEMLGRIFENLLAEVSEETGAQARKSKGAFYTPREVVDFMCKESLKAYLKTKIVDDENLNSRLYQLVDAPEREYHDQDHNWRQDLKPYREKILKALDDLKVFDPACGSGAFPIGMMQLLVKVYSRIEPRFDTQKAKLSIVDKNIFGADIEPMAVEISRLRTWLALMVDEHQGRLNVKPLPNLDFKFVCANALVSLEQSETLSIFDDHELENRLQGIRERYFSTQNIAKKKTLRTKYQSLVQQEMTLFGETKRTAQLKSFQPFESDQVSDFFDSGQMFGVQNFDIIIANPPYIGEKGNKEIFRAVKNSSLGKRFSQAKMDYFYYFFHLAMDLCASDGVICFITTNYFPKAPSAKSLRIEMQKNTNVLRLINFQDLKIFKSAVGQHNMITVLSRSEPNPAHVVQTCVTNRRGDADSSILKSILTGHDKDSSYFEIKQSELFKGDRLDIIIKAGTELDQVLDRIEEVSVPLGSLVTITNGLHTGADDAFVFSETPQVLMRDSDVCKAFIKPLHKNSDIFKYGLRDTKKNVLYIPSGLELADFPSVRDYLTPFKSKLSSRAQIVRSQQPWHQLLWPRDPKIFAPGPKIVAPYSSRENCFFFTEEQFYGSGDTYLLTSKTGDSLKPLVAILNSTLGLVWFKNRGKLKGNMIFLQGDSLGVFPVSPALGENNLLELTRAVDAIHQLVSKSGEFSEVYRSPEYGILYKRIDELVFRLYGLVETEISLITAEAEAELGDSVPN
jgi:hypothetical protein